MNDLHLVQLAEENQKLKKELAATQMLLETANSIIIRCDQQGTIHYINKFGLEFFGYTADELIGKNVMILLPKQEKGTGRNLEALLEDILQRPECYHSVVNENITKEGQSVWISWANKSVLDESGNIREFLTIGNDITAIKKTEEQLKEVLQFNQLIIEHTPMGFLVFKESGPCILANPAAEAITGGTREQLLKLNYREMESYRKTGILTDMEEALRTGSTIQNEVHFTNTFGKEVWLKGYCSSVEIGREKHVLFLFNDIMLRKSLEQSLIKAKEQWEETFDAISEGVSIIDENHQIIRSNKAFARLMNRPVQEVVGQNCHAIFHGTDCAVSNCPAQRAFLSKQLESMEIQLADGRWLWVTVEPIKGDYADAGHYVHIVRDISALKQQEKEIVAARKAEAFSVLSGGIAHDYNNLLAVIWGNISLAKENVENARALELLEPVETACKNARDLTHQFITLSRGAELNKTSTDLNDVLTAALDCVEPDDRFEVTVDRMTDHCMVEADGKLLTFALKNILINAVEAMPGGGKLKVRLEAISRSDGGAISDFKLTFTDTGRGIPSSDLSKVFDPYFTTKRMGIQKGMGLGLAVCKSIIEKHGGQILIDSTHGQGTTVVVSLPLAPRSRLTKQLPERLTQPVVLLMEDESSLRKTVDRMLTHLNCTVLIAAHGQEAIEIYQEVVRSNQSIDLILLDQTIKDGMDGIETLREMHKLGFTNKAVVISGSPNSPAITNFKEYGFDDTIVKPFAMEELKTVLDQYLPINNETCFNL